MTPITLSHSQLDTYRRCPRAWWLDKVRRVPSAPARWFTAGVALHAALEADGHAARNATPRLSLADLRAAYRAALQQDLTTRDPHGLLASDLPRMLADGDAALAVYHARVAPAYHPVAVEAPPETIDLGDGVRFTGKIDSITEPTGPDGQVIRTIVDFKSASQPWAAGEEHHKPQATAYLMLLAGTPLEASRVTFITFPRCRDGSTVLDVRTTTRTAGQIADYAALGMFVGQEMRALKAGAPPPEAVPGEAAGCQFCGLLHACAPGRAWLAASGKRALLPVLPVVEVEVTA